MIKRIMRFVGAVQVMITHSLFYLTVTNAAMLALTFWTTTAAPVAETYAPWMGAKEFIGLVILGLVCIMLFDYKIMYPFRQRFINLKTCEFENPAMDELRAIRADITKIKERLGITDDDSSVDTGNS